MVGGISGLWGALILGPRIGKFDASTKESEFYPVSLGNVRTIIYVLLIKNK